MKDRPIARATRSNGMWVRCCPGPVVHTVAGPPSSSWCRCAPDSAAPQTHRFNLAAFHPTTQNRFILSVSITGHLARPRFLVNRSPPIGRLPSTIRYDTINAMRPKQMRGRETLSVLCWFGSKKPITMYCLFSTFSC